MKRPVAKFECLACGYSDYRMSARPIGDLAISECPKCKGDMAVVSSGVLPPRLAKVESLVGKRFEVVDFDMTEERMRFEVAAPDPKASFRRLLRDLKPHGYLPAMRKHRGELRLFVGRRPEIKEANVAINILLLAATFVTTFSVGYFLSNSLLYASLFSGSIMLVLGAHELGHKITAWRHGVEATLPYFIPAPPPFIGTFGAVIKIKSPIPTKEALVEMGASGPVFGFLVALPITIVGLLSPRPQVEIPIPFVPLAFGLLQFLTLGRIPSLPRLHPMAFAGLVGMFVTMLNLIPAGQLDGGHVSRGLLSREKQYGLTRLLGLGLIGTGFFLPELPLWLFGLLVLILFRGYHFGALDDASKLAKRQKLLAAAVFVLFLLTLPIPL